MWTEVLEVQLQSDIRMQTISPGHVAGDLITVVEEELLSVYWKHNVQDSSDDFKLDQIHA